jgi:Ca2+-binding EF-hand superfamily protein
MTDKSKEDQVLQELFAKYDTNGNGRLEKPELPAMVADLNRILGIDASSDDIIKAMDVNGDGTIDFQEFKQLLGRVG